MKKALGLKIDTNLNIRNHNNKIIVPKDLKLNNFYVNQSRQNVNQNGIHFMKRNLTGYQFGIH
jgi:hypothetical protein